MGFENFNFKRKFNYKVFLPLLLGLASVQSLEASNTEPGKPAEAKPVNTEISSNDALDQSSVRHMTEQARAKELRAEGFNPWAKPSPDTRTRDVNVNFIADDGNK